MIGLQNMRAGKKLELEDQYRCSFYYGLSAAVLATPELAFSAGLDGRIRAFDVVSGDILWQAATALPFEADNGITGHGGAIDVSRILEIEHDGRVCVPQRRARNQMRMLINHDDGHTQFATLAQ